METSFSIVLWAMYSRTKDYYMPHICPWSLDTIEYDGCCSHVAIYEIVSGEEDGLTLEQLATKQVELDQRRKENHKTYYYDFKRLNFEEWKARIRRQDAQRDPEEKTATAKKTKATAIAARRFSCDLCNYVGQDSKDLNKHNATKKHIDKARGVNRIVKHPEKRVLASANLASRRFFCRICDHPFSTSAKLNIHLATKKHLAKAAAAESRASSF